MDPDEITDVVQILPARRQKSVIIKLKKHLQQTVELLTQFDPKTAAGLMNIDYIQVTEKDTIAHVAKRFKAHEKRTGRLPAIIVMRGGKVMGYIPGHELGFALPTDTIKQYVHHISTIPHNLSHAETVNHFREHPHNKVVVLGDKKNVLGIIYADDVLHILEDQESASLYDFAGVHDEELVTDTATMKVKHRYKWLIINLGTAFLASFTVSLFDETISKYVLLAVYMPIVAGMGGNAATQTLAVLVRGIALKQIEFRTAWPTLRREVSAGLLNGIINGIIVAAIVIVINHDYRIALILSLAMIVNLVVAGTFGTIVPLLMQKFGKDPAASATVFITTATDVLGFLAFLGLATLIL
jgi:magnesium transporter